MKGMMVSIYDYSEGAITTGEISSQSKRALLVGDNIDKIFEEGVDLQPVEIRKIGGLYCATPVAHGNWEWGGTFIYTSDSRFPFDHAIPLYDKRKQD